MALEQSTTVRWFHSGMAGAPQLNANAGDFIAILDACLIEGFAPAAPDGDKITILAGVATVEISASHGFEELAVIAITGATPSALNDVWRVTSATNTTFTFDCPGIADGKATGNISVRRAPPGHWEKAFGDGFRGAYRSTHPSATGNVLSVDNRLSGTEGVPIKGYISMSAIDTGAGPFPPAEDVFWRMKKNLLDTARPWALLVDEGFLHFFVRWELDPEYDRGCSYFSFGDLAATFEDLFATVITGHNTSTPLFAYSDTDAFCLEDYSKGCFFAGTSAGETAGAVPYFRRGVGDMYGTVATSGVRSFSFHSFGQIPLSLDLFGPALAADTQGIRGEIPGLFECSFGEAVVNADGFAENQFAIFRDKNSHPYFLAKLGATQLASTRCKVVAVDIGGSWR